MSVTDEVSELPFVQSLAEEKGEEERADHSLPSFFASFHQPDRKQSKSRGQMVWQPEEGFLSKSTVEQRAGTSLSSFLHEFAFKR